MTRLDRELNLYGDRSCVLDQAHGTDISSVRFDDLDRSFVQFAAAAQPASVVDLGCGRAAPTLIASAFGHAVRLYDLHQDYVPLGAFKSVFPHADVEVHGCDLAVDAGLALLPAAIGVLYSQRFLHYLSRPRALALLAACRVRMPEGADAFLSASGLESELGEGYAYAASPPAERFAPLAQPMADKHHMREPVCLYRRDEFVALLNEAGFACQSAWLSAFGNVKGRFRAA